MTIVLQPRSDTASSVRGEVQAQYKICGKQRHCKKSGILFEIFCINLVYQNLSNKNLAIANRSRISCAHN